VSADGALAPRLASPPAPNPAPRPRLVMPKEPGRGRARLPLIIGAVVVVAAGAGALVRHALLHAPGRIEIVTIPPDAEIFIDGQKMADRSPLFLDASPGAYTVEVRSAGYETLTRVLEMKPRDAERVPLALTALPVSRPFAPAHRASGGGAAPAHRRAAPAINGVTFIDFKKASAAQNAH
jgi:hypothetical protein